MYSRKLSKSVQKPFSRTVLEAYLGLNPDNYFVLLVPVPGFILKRTPSLAAFPKLVKHFQSTTSKKGTVPFLKGLILRHGALANSDLSSLVLGLGWGRTWVRPQPNPRSR